AQVALQETRLDSAAPQAVLDHAGQRLSVPCELPRSDPIRFHLLHRPDGRDVFLVQYSHALTDHADVVRLLGTLDRPTTHAPRRPGSGAPFFARASAWTSGWPGAMSRSGTT